MTNLVLVYGFLLQPCMAKPQTRCSLRPRPIESPCSASCLMSSKSIITEEHRRSANYHSTIWDHQFIQSLKSPYTYERFNTKLEGLKQKAKWAFRSNIAKEPVLGLKFIDTIQRLGLGYHFEEEIKQAFELIPGSGDWSDVYTTALSFRLRRQNGYQVNPDVFEKFKSNEWRFMESLSQDVEGLLSLFEASQLSLHGEDVLEKARKFTHDRLKFIVDHMDNFALAKHVQHSLASPLHWRMIRLESRNFINLYERHGSKNIDLLDFSKLDFNLVQSIHQNDLIELSIWWNGLGISRKLSFSRDRLMENFIWATGIIYEPQFSKCRVALTKFICILTIIDDMYDVYGSLDELELFTEAVNRWDVKATEHLPDYMKICYSAMVNFANDFAYETERAKAINVLPYIKKEWGSLCRSYLVEARWFFNGYRPTLEEYLENAYTSVGGPASMVHAYILHGDTITKDTLDCLKNGSKLVYWASLVTRLNDDLGTSENEMARGDVPKAIQCHMNETSVSEKEAREYTRGLVTSSWKNLNEECAKSSLPKPLVNMIVNMARTSQTIFEHGDGIGTSNGVTKDRINSMFIEPIPIEGTRNIIN